MKKILYLPIETKSREFPGKLLLACFAAESGFKVLIGNRGILNGVMKKLPRGIYFYNATMPPDVENIRRCKEVGHSVVVLDEEGLLFQSSKHYQETRLSRQALLNTSIIFAWGPRQRRTIIDFEPEIKGKIRVVGNPRIDLLHSKLRNIQSQQLNNITKKYGTFILINTNFSLVNNFNDSNYYFEMYKKFGFIKDEEDHNRYRKLFDDQLILFKEFKQMARAISKKFPEINLVIRPHPSENLEGWMDLQREYNNIFVVREGNVHDWIMASKAVIHNSCTTGLEAFILDKPVISYTPMGLKVDGFDITNNVSYETGNLTELTNKLQEILYDDKNLIYETEGRKRMLSDYIVIKEDELSCERIVNSLNNIDLKNDTNINLTPLLEIYWRVAKNKVKFYISRLLKLKNSNIYYRSKFNSITRADLKLFKRYKHEFDMFRDLKAKKLTSDLLIIEKKETNRN